MGKKKRLSREEYAEKFEELFSKINYIPQSGEKIVQCKEPYPDYWFVSNKGYVFSVYKNNIKVIKPNFDCTGKANKEGKRVGKGLRYGTRISGNKNLTRYDMGKLMTDHFTENEFKSDEDTEIHHIRKRKNFESNEAQFCNRADNLQILPVSIHKKLTQYSNKTNKELDLNIDQKIKKSECPSCLCTQEQLQNICRYALQDCLDQGVYPVIYTMTINDDVQNIESEAHLIKSVDII